jgi:hypothetical protein
MKVNLTQEPTADYGKEPAKLPKSTAELMVENANRPFVPFVNSPGNEPVD